MGGLIKYSRSVLFPADCRSAERLAQLSGVKSVAPLDEALGTDNLPFKITKKMMLRIAKAGMETPSYEEASQRFREGWNISVSADVIRRVTDYI